MREESLPSEKRVAGVDGLWICWFKDEGIFCLFLQPSLSQGISEERICVCGVGVGNSKSQKQKTLLLKV